MKLAPLLLLFSLFASCSSIRNWRELQTDPMSIGEAYNGFVAIATARDGWRVDESKTDSGNGKWESRWRKREMERNFPIRNRLRMEILLDEGSREEGWWVRYVIEQEKCKDLRRHSQPREEDWSANGQDQEGEAILGERLLRRLAPKSVQIPERTQPKDPWSPIR
ncbi:MAG: hypothetical protein ACI89X_004346 [Planctomycetota bacterium]|jgi:hypothetical protein